MTNEQELKKIFEMHRVDIPDGEFSVKVKKRLPQRTSILPQVVMVLCISVGFILTLAIQGIDPVATNISDFVSAISRLQIPPTVSIITYLSGLVLLSVIGYVVATADAK
jgi:hypothetical protein